MSNAITVQTTVNTPKARVWEYWNKPEHITGWAFASDDWEAPERFFTLEQARSFCREFFRWYNTEHRHSGIAMMTPEVMHSGQAAAVHTARQQVLDLAYATHPERFVQRPPALSPLPTAVYINPPKPAPAVTQEVLQ